MTQRGKFIIIEGVEGAGKTTNIPFIQELLTEKSGAEIIHTREPGGTEPGEAIREVLISTELPAMHHDTELLLMFAARAEHIRKKIEPALAAGQWVLCDRFTDASYAYQGGGRGIPLERIAELENWVQGELRPDYTILFDVDAETGLGRARSRGETDRFEAEDIEFFNRVRRQYQTMAEQNPDRYSIIDAGASFTEVQQQLEQVISDVIVSSYE